MYHTGTIRVMLVDNHDLMRAGLRAIVGGRSRLEVVAEAKTNRQSVSLAARHRPDVILYDGDDGALELAHDMMAASQGARSLILSRSYEFKVCLEAMQIGADGVIWKKERPVTLVKAIRTVYGGESWFSRSMLSRLLIEMQQPRAEPPAEQAMIASLTDRELEVIALLGEGLRNREISDRLFISESTVRHHFASIYSKLNVSDRLALLVFAYRFGIVAQPC